MVDTESVSRRLLELEKRTQKLRTIREATQERFLQAEGLQAEAERHLQIAIQAIIDIATHLIAEKGGGPVDDYASAVVKLAELGAIDGHLAERLRRAVGLRNILVHAYLEVDPRIIWQDLDALEDFAEFAGAIQMYIDRSLS